MNPAIVIPTYWSTGDRLGNPGGTYCYDHATPIDKPDPDLENCLASLEQVAGLTHVILLVVAPPAVEERAVHRVHEIASAHNLPDVLIVDSFKAGFVVEQFSQLLPPDIGEPISLRGYGAIRNMGLLACCAIGADLAVFIDDDEIVLDPDFLANAAYGIGAKPRSGVPVMVKSGYFLDRRNSALADRRQVASYDKYWAKRQEFNQWMTQALAGPRISRSNTVCGGCFSVHAEAFTRVAFDPWITRGEDLDYMFNLRFYGMDVWFDNRWRVRHNPPRIKDTSFRFLQDVYRWVYERRKIEIGNSHIDLHKLSPDLFMPYPGPWIGPELPKRIKKTALRRAIQTKEHLDYFKIWRHGLTDATDYAEQNCTRYYEFQIYWNDVATNAWRNEAIEHILRAEGMLNSAVAQRMARRNGIPEQPVDESVAEKPAQQQAQPAQGAEATGVFETVDNPAQPVQPSQFPQAAAAAAGAVAGAPAWVATSAAATGAMEPAAQGEGYAGQIPGNRGEYGSYNRAAALSGYIFPEEAAAQQAAGQPGFAAQQAAAQPAPAPQPVYQPEVDYAAHGAALAAEQGVDVAPADPLLYAVTAPEDGVVPSEPAPAAAPAQAVAPAPVAEVYAVPEPAPTYEPAFQPAFAAEAPAVEIPAAPEAAEAPVAETPAADLVVPHSPVDELEDVAIAFATGSFPAVAQPQEVADQVEQAVDQTASQVAQAASETLADVQAAAEQAAEAADALVAEPVAAVEQVVSDVADNAAEAFDAVTETVADAVADAADQVSDAVAEPAETVEQAVSDIADDAAEAFAAVADEVAEDYDAVTDAAADAADQVADAVAEPVEAVEQTLSDTVADAAEALDAVADAADEVADTDAVSDVANAIDQVVSGLAAAPASVMEQVASALADASDAVAEPVSAVAETVADLAADAPVDPSTAPTTVMPVVDEPADAR